MLMRFNAENVVAHRLLPDGSGVVVVIRSGEDHIEMVFHAAALGEVHQTIGGIVTALEDAGVKVAPGHVHARFPETVAVSIAPTMQPPGICVVYDAGKPTQTAMAMSAFAARQVGRDLIAKARSAQQTKAPPPYIPPPQPANEAEKS